MDPIVTPLAVAAAKAAVPKLAEILIKPLLSAAKSVSDPIADFLGNRFSDYLERQVVKHSYLPTIVFQVRQPLEEIYIPLTVVEESIFADDGKRSEFKLSKYHADFIPKLERVIVIDSAGMGKTTLSRFLFLQAIKTLITVPIFIELRHLSSGRAILDYVLGELNPMGGDPKDPKIDRRQLVRLLEKGVFTFFLDGYDEVSNSLREFVTRDIKNLAETYPQNKFLITSRPEHALASFPSFHAFKIRSLKKEEAFLLIRKYDKNGEKGERLIARLSDDSLPEVDNFLENPLLTTLLYRAYDYKAQIPLKKPNFYRQVFDALFEWHDLTKDGYSTRDKISKLDVDGFHKVLRGLGFISIIKGRVEAERDEMLKWIREARTSYAPDLKFAESDFLEDAIKAVPVFRREGETIIWSHKSLAEYFCASFLISDARKDQEKIFKYFAENFNLPSYRNVLDLLYDMDVVLFGVYFINPLLDFYERELARLQGMFPGFPVEHVQVRAAASFGLRYFVLSTSPKKNGFGEKIEERIRNVSREAVKDWFGMEAQFREKGLIDDRLHFGFGNGGNNGILCLSHPLRTVFSVLINKRHPLVLMRHFYPSTLQNGRVLGTRDSQGLSINESTSAVWNNARNFSKTSAAMAMGSIGIINLEKIGQVRREIEQTSGKSKTTESLLAGLGI